MRGYYMLPDIYGDDIIFVTEDDLWKFSRGVGVRLTSDFGVVVRPKFSPDGRWMASLGFNRLTKAPPPTYTGRGAQWDHLLRHPLHEGGRLDPRREVPRIQRLQDAFHPVARALRSLPHRGLREAELRSRHGAGVRRRGGYLRPQHLRPPPLEAVLRRSEGRPLDKQRRGPYFPEVPRPPGQRHLAYAYRGPGLLRLRPRGGGQPLLRGPQRRRHEAPHGL